jgi:phosphate transport system substrate-binding protein
MNIKYLIVLGLVLFLAGCGITDNDQPPEEVVDISVITKDNFPRVDGSTSTHPLMVLIACEILNVNYRWLPAFDGTMRVYPYDEDTTKQDIVQFIQGIRHYGTHESYVNLISDSADIIIAAREPSEDELNFADSMNVQLNITPVALDALVFILNKGNGVNNLTEDQIIKIYTGVIINWMEVGGNNAPINAYQREKNSGSQELIEKLVMRGLTMIEAPQMILYGMMGPINRLVDDQNGIGYTVYFFNTAMAPRDQIKMCAVNGIMPDQNSIRMRTYPYTAEVYAAIRSDLDQNSTAFLLWKWLQTIAGQNVIGESGYIPYTGN